MKIFTTNLVEDTKTNKSFNVMKQFCNGIDVEFSTTDKINSESSDLGLVLIDYDTSLFSPESLIELSGAYEHFSEIYPELLFVTQNNVDFYKYPEISVTRFGGGRFWKTASRYPSNAIIFGKESVLAKALSSENERLFNNGVMISGPITIMHPIPSIIDDTIIEVMPSINSQMFNLDSFSETINSIPGMSSETPVQMSIEFPQGETE